MSWQLLPKLAAVYGGNAFTSDGVKLYSLGGYDSSYAALDSVFAYDPSLQGWVSLHALPGPVAVASAASVGGKIYIFGGYGVGYAVLDTVYVYDPAHDSAGWTSLHVLPAAIDNTSAATFGGKLYVTNQQYSTGVYVYDPANDSAGWSAVSGAPNQSSGGLVGTASKLYYLGGVDSSFSQSGAVYSYDPTAGWLTVSSLPTASQGAAGVLAADSRIWASVPAPSGGSANGTYSYDPTDDPAGWRTEVTLAPTGGASGHGQTVNRIGDFIFYGDSSPLVAELVVAVPTGKLYPAWVVGATGVSPGHLLPYEYSIDLRDEAAGQTTVTAEMGYTSTPPEEVDGYTDVAVDITVLLTGDTYPDLVAARTVVAAAISLVEDFTPGTVHGRTVVAAAIGLIEPLTPAVAAGHTAVTAAITVIGTAVSFTPALVAGRTVITAREAIAGFRPALVAGRTSLGIVPVINLEFLPDPVYAQATVAVSLSFACVFAPALVAGSTRVHVVAEHHFQPDVVRGVAAVTAAMSTLGVRKLLPALVAGSTTVRVVAYPTTIPGSASIINTPILIAIGLSAMLESVDTLVSP